MLYKNAIKNDQLVTKHEDIRTKGSTIRSNFKISVRIFQVQNDNRENFW